MRFRGASPPASRTETTRDRFGVFSSVALVSCGKRLATNRIRE